MLNGYEAYTRSFSAGLEPDPPLWVDEWADANMVIPSESGVAEPGPYRLSRTPYAGEPMRALSPEHPSRKVVIKGASQLLKTQIALNWMGSLIDKAPANIILLEPTDRLAKRVSARFDKTVEAVPVLRSKVAYKRDRDSRNTSDTKEFKGGTAWFLSARSASNLAEASARWIIVDEVDRLLRELKGEGDPIGLAEKRQTTYGRKAKGLYISSPTEEDASRIDELFREGDQRQYHVHCPHCGEQQALEWERLQWDTDADNGKGRAWYVCAQGCVIQEHYKPKFLAEKSHGGTAEWVPTAKGNPDVWSGEISSLYAPLGWVSWMDLAKEWEEADKALKLGDNEKMQVFYNTRLARTWSAKSAKVKPEWLKERAEAYPLGAVPYPALQLTATSDVQGNRIECQIVGWGPGAAGLECWIVQTHILYGDPILPEVWKELDEILKTPIRHASGTLLYIRAAGIDSGDGDSTLEVYEFTRPRRRRFVGGQLQEVFAVKGASKALPAVLGRPSKVEYNYRGRAVPGGAELQFVGTEKAKDWIFGRIGLESQTAIHTSHELPIEFYEQLLSETKEQRWVKGKKRSAYVPIKRGIRNEQLDMLVYNLAMAHRVGIDKYNEARWRQLASQLNQTDMLAELDSPAQQPQAASVSPRPASVSQQTDSVSQKAGPVSQPMPAQKPKRRIYFSPY